MCWFFFLSFFKVVPMPTLENIASTKTLATLEVLNVKMVEIAPSLWTPPEDQLSNVIVPSDTQLHFVKLLWRTIHVLTALAGEYTFLGNSTIYFSTFLVKFQWENNYVFLYWYFDETKNWFHEKILIYFVLYIYRNGGTCSLQSLSNYTCTCPVGWKGEMHNFVSL